MRHVFIAVIAMAALGACAMQQAPAQPPAAATPAAAVADDADLVSDGRDIAEGQCARCHAVGVIGDSPNPAAPLFRNVLSRYRGDVLESELIEGIRVSHPMPNFQFNPQGAHALLAYLRSIQQPAPAE